MNDIGTVNDQVVDSVNSVNTLLAGQSPAHAFAMLDTVMAETLGMAMYNAVNRQQNAGMVNSAAVTAACARMLNAYPPAPAPDPAPPPPPPPTVHALPPPTPAPSGDVMVKTAFSQGGNAITVLQGAAASAGAVAQEANDDLQSLAKLAAMPPAGASTATAKADTAANPANNPTTQS